MYLSCRLPVPLPFIAPHVIHNPPRPLSTTIILHNDIWLFCIPRAIHLTVEYCLGVDNVEADTASHNFTDATEWSLHPDVFKKISGKLEHTDIDFFASDENYKVKPYASELLSVNAFSRDAFNCSWTNSNGFFFPPFCLASRVLKKMTYDKATGVIVLPRWPSQPWFTALMNLMPTTAYMISVEGHTLFLPHAPEKTHPLAGRLELIAARVSPLRSRHKAWRCGPARQRNNIKCTSTNGYSSPKLRDFLIIVPPYRACRKGLPSCNTCWEAALNKYSGLNTARSMLLAFVILPGGQTFGKHPHVSRFIRGVSKLCPALPKYDDTSWNLTVVITC